MRCKNCKVKFDKRWFTQKYCLQNDECISASIEFAKKEVEKAKAKAWKQRKAGLENDTKKHPAYKNDLQILINEIARLIDKGQPCIATGATTGKMNAGHYVAVSANDTIRFNLHNIHIQSEHSNSHKAGDTLRYQDGIKRIYGEDYLEMMNDLRKTPLIKLSVNDIKEKIVIAREIIKELKVADKSFEPRNRIKIRTLLNNRLGIYK